MRQGERKLLFGHRRRMLSAGREGGFCLPTFIQLREAFSDKRSVKPTSVIRKKDFELISQISLFAMGWLRLAIFLTERDNFLSFGIRWDDVFRFFLRLLTAGERKEVKVKGERAGGSIQRRASVPS